MVASVRSCLGEKQITLQIPGSASATSKPALSTSNLPGDVSGFNAAKSFSKTKVVVYDGLRNPPARRFPGQRKQPGSYVGWASVCALATSPCQGRVARCGETSTHSFVNA